MHDSSNTNKPTVRYIILNILQTDNLCNFQKLKKAPVNLLDKNCF